MANVLLVSGHPDLTASIANKTIINTVKSLVPATEVRDLGALYGKTRYIDVAAEQKAFAAADVIVFQFPFYWFTMPALLKQYIDDVLAHGFAYNSKGGMLQGKKAIFSFTAAGSAEDYTPEGNEGHTIDTFVPPLAQIAHFCGMENPENFITLGAALPMAEQSAIDDTIARSKEHGEKLAAFLKSL